MLGDYRVSVVIWKEFLGYEAEQAGKGIGKDCWVFLTLHEKEMHKIWGLEKHLWNLEKKLIQKSKKKHKMSQDE